MAEAALAATGLGQQQGRSTENRGKQGKEEDKGKGDVWGRERKDGGNASIQHDFCCNKINKSLK